MNFGDRQNEVGQRVRRAIDGVNECLRKARLARRRVMFSLLVNAPMEELVEYSLMLNKLMEAYFREKKRRTLTRKLEIK